MSKSTAKRDYRLHYNAKLKASLEARLRSPRIRNRRGRLVFVGLFAVITLLLSGGVYAVHLYGQSVKNVAAGTKQNDNDADKNVTTKATLASATTLKKGGQVDDFPYNKTIGFVGDSITFGCCSDATPAPTVEVKELGDGYRAINRGVNGSTTRDWLNTLLEPAMVEFKQNDVEVVQMMLGTNDVMQSIPTDEVVSNLRTIAERLIDNGAKLVIVNKIPYASDRDELKMRQLNTVLDRLPDNKHIYLGDEDSFDHFYLHRDQLIDGVHMTEDGYAELGRMWAKSLKRVVAEAN